MDLSADTFAVLPSMWSISSAAGCTAYPQSIHPLRILKSEIQAFTARDRTFADALDRSRYPGFSSLRSRHALLCSGVGLARGGRALLAHNDEQYLADSLLVWNGPLHWAHRRSFAGVFPQGGMTERYPKMI